MSATAAQNVIAVVGIDIGKNSFHVVALDDRGAIVLRQKWSRGQVEARLDGSEYLRQELMWAIRDPRRSSHFCRLPCKPHIRRELIPTTFPHSGTGELQENGTTLCRRRRSAMPNNGAVPSDRRTALRSQRNPDC